MSKFANLFTMPMARNYIYCAILLLNILTVVRIYSKTKSMMVQDNIATLELQTFAANYNEYLEIFGKSYARDETKMRFQVFKNSMKEINRLNQLGEAVYGWTKFTDVPVREMFPSKQLAVTDIENYGMSCNIPDDFHKKDIPKKVDWRQKGKVGPVLDQRACNGCWAFGIIGVMESMASQSGLTRLSIQQLLDCPTRPSKERGCYMGNVNRYLLYMVKTNMSVVTEEEYSLTLADEKCLLENNPPGRRVACYSNIKKDNPQVSDEEFMLRVLAYRGPIMALVNAEPWRNYIDQVISGACFRSKDHTTVDHVVQIVGYDLSPPPPELPHYIVRNSWGKDFGIDGYVKLALFKNVCGVAEEITFLEVN